jgi:lipoprotein signal peptidase
MAQMEQSSTDSDSRRGLPADSAIRYVHPHLRLWIVTLVFLVLDLWSKAWAIRTLPVEIGTPTPHLFGLITFRRSFNAGALFGLGEGMSPLFVAASVLALLFVLYLFACSARRQWVMHVALGLILAGALGNLYDRATCLAHLVTFETSEPGITTTAAMEIVGDPNADPVLMRHFGTDEEPVTMPRDRIVSVRRQGVVRDFIKIEPIFGIDVWRWVFNIADVALTCGVVILLINFWFDRRQARPAVESTTTASTEDASA